MTDAYAEQLTPPPAPDEPVDHLPDNDPGTADLDPDEQGGGDH